MSRKRNLFLLLGVLILLLAVYMGLQTWNQRQEEEQAREEEASVIHITNADPEEITYMSFNVGNGDMAFEKHSGDMSRTF